MTAETGTLGVLEGELQNIEAKVTEPFRNEWIRSHHPSGPD